MSAKREGSPLSAEEVRERMRFLGWITHDQDGNVTDECFHVSRELAGKVVDSVVLSSQIATAVDAYRAKSASPAK